MTRFTISLLAGAALTTAVPALAQTNYDPYPSTYNGQVYAGQNGTQNRIAQLDARLQAGISTGAITRAEARPLRQQIRYLAQLEQRYAADGLSQQERRDLQQRYRYTRKQLRAADPNNSRYAQWDQANDDPYADSGYNTGVQYQQVSQVCRAQQSGFKGILSSVFGTDNCLRVGERVTSSAGLSAVPDPFDDQFRNTSTHTFRFYEGNVIQIENRTALVTNIYDVRYGG